MCVVLRGRAIFPAPFPLFSVVLVIGEWVGASWGAGGGVSQVLWVPAKSGCLPKVGACQKWVPAKSGCLPFSFCPPPPPHPRCSALRQHIMDRCTFILTEAKSFQQSMIRLGQTRV